MAVDNLARGLAIKAMNMTDGVYYTKEEVDTRLASKEEKATISAATMSESGWSGSEYSFEGTYPVSTYNIEIQPNGDNITDDQLKAWSKAKICGSYDANKAIAKGTVPAIDMPIILKVVDISA